VNLTTPPAQADKHRLQDFLLGMGPVPGHVVVNGTRLILPAVVVKRVPGSGGTRVIFLDLEDPVHGGRPHVGDSRFSSQSVHLSYGGGGEDCRCHVSNIQPRGQDVKPPEQDSSRLPRGQPPSGVPSTGRHTSNY